MANASQTRILAVTGATGFAGGHFLEAAHDAGFAVRALTRRPQPPAPGVSWVAGDLADLAALRTLTDGADAIVHIAGLTNAASFPPYVAANVEGTRALRQAAPALPFVHVSSLAARAPELSFYGRSKRLSEEAVREGAGPFVILRPPAIYGPGDRELLALFEAARMRVLPLPRKARASMLYCTDLAAALVALASDLLGDRKSAGHTFEIDDGHGGYAQSELAQRIAGIMGIRAVTLPVPAAAIRLAGLGAGLWGKATGRLPRFSRDRARYLAHRDWSADSRPLIALGIWRPEVGLEEGLRHTIAAYRGKGWL